MHIVLDLFNYKIMLKKLYIYIYIYIYINFLFFKKTRNHISNHSLIPIIAFGDSSPFIFSSIILSTFTVTLFLFFSLLAHIYKKTQPITEDKLDCWLHYTASCIFFLCKNNIYVFLIYIFFWIKNLNCVWINLT